MLLSKLMIGTALLAGPVIIVGAGLVYRTQAAEETVGGKTETQENTGKDEPKPKGQRDENAIQGTWVIVEFEQSNVLLPRDLQEMMKAGGLRVIISGETMSFPGWKAGEWKYKLDETVKPKRMTLKMEQDATVPAIYELHGEELKICFGQKYWRDPPSSFDVHNLQTAGMATSWILKKNKIHQLLKERFAALAKLAIDKEDMYRQGRCGADEVQRARLMVLRAGLELCESDDARLRVHEKIVANAKKQEEYIDQMYKEGKLGHSEMLTAQVNRLEAEIELERVKARVASKPK